MNSTDFGNGSSTSSTVIRDQCGRVQDLRYINDWTDWVWITRISFPIFLITCTVGNSIGIFVAWNDVKGTKRSFLLCLFATNLCFMWNKFFLFLGTGVWTPPNPDALYGGFFLATGGYWMYMDSILYLASQWTVLAFCLERYIALTNPLHHYARQRKIGVIGTLTIIFLGSAISSLYGPISYYWQQSQANMQLGSQYQQVPNMLATWRRVDMWFEVIIRASTYGSIVLLDLLIVSSLSRTKRNNLKIRTNTSNGTTSSSSAASVKPLVDAAETVGFKRLRASRSATKTLIFSSIFFLISQSLEMAMPILVLSNNPPLCTYQITMKFLLIYGPIQVMFCTSYFACSFFVYISPGFYYRSRKTFTQKNKHGGGNRNGTMSMCTSTSAITVTSSC